jgi:hypothetical protein
MDLKPYVKSPPPANTGTKLQFDVKLEPNSDNITVAFINNSSYSQGIMKPTLLDVYNGVKVSDFPTSYNAYELPKYGDVVDIILNSKYICRL